MFRFRLILTKDTHLKFTYSGNNKCSTNNSRNKCSQHERPNGSGDVPSCQTCSGQVTLFPSIGSPSIGSPCIVNNNFRSIIRCGNIIVSVPIIVPCIVTNNFRNIIISRDARILVVTSAFIICAGNVGVARYVFVTSVIIRADAAGNVVSVAIYTDERSLAGGGTAATAAAMAATVMVRFTSTVRTNGTKGPVIFVALSVLFVDGTGRVNGVINVVQDSGPPGAERKFTMLVRKVAVVVISTEKSGFDFQTGRLDGSEGEDEEESKSLNHFGWCWCWCDDNDWVFWNNIFMIQKSDWTESLLMSWSDWSIISLVQNGWVFHMILTAFSAYYLNTVTSMCIIIFLIMKQITVLLLRVQCAATNSHSFEHKMTPFIAENRRILSTPIRNTIKHQTPKCEQVLE